MLLTTSQLAIDEAARAEEQPCDRCGSRNPVWWSTNAAWNLAAGGQAHREAGGILCPTCFHKGWLSATSSTNSSATKDGE